MSKYRVHIGKGKYRVHIGRAGDMSKYRVHRGRGNAKCVFSYVETLPSNWSLLHSGLYFSVTLCQGTCILLPSGK